MSETDPEHRKYRNPPIEHRFRKGVSGNPRGRPRKTPKTPAFVTTKVDGLPGIGPEDPIKSLAIKEAYRLVTVREGERVKGSRSFRRSCARSTPPRPTAMFGHSNKF